MDVQSLRHPTPGPERHEGIDAVRGVAIFGILLVNMHLFSEPIWTEVTGVTRWASSIDPFVHWLIVFFAQSKFYSLFSMLFGLGLAMQSRRAERRHQPVAPLFARRLRWLAVIGAFHAFVIWYGDILLIYALLGFVLVPFLESRPRTLLLWAAGFACVPSIFFGVAAATMAFAQSIGGKVLAEINEGMAENQAEALRSVETSMRLYGSGSAPKVWLANALQWKEMAGSIAIFGPTILAMFLVGLYFGRRGIPDRFEDWVPRIRRNLPWLAALGVFGNGVAVVAGMNSNPAVPSPVLLLGNIGLAAGAPALALTYASIVLLAARRSRSGWIPRLAAVGRMALTNYLLHSTVFVTSIVYLGFYGRIAPSVGLALTLVMFALQLAISPWWLRRFHMGPAEWVWRSLTYGHAQPLRRKPANS